MRKHLFLSAIRTLTGVVAVVVADGQPINLTGAWSGQITQPGGPADQVYGYQMVIQQDSSGAITGSATTYALPQPTAYITYSLTGKVSGSTVTFQEGRVIAQGNRSWCVKSGTLTVNSTDTQITGSWQSPGCVPGNVSLTKTNGPTFIPPGATRISALLNQPVFVQDLFFFVNNPCTFLGPAVGTVTIPPQHGTLSFQTQNIERSLNGCPSQTYQATFAYYTWTDTAPGTAQDYFRIHWTAPDGSSPSDNDWVAVLPSYKANGTACPGQCMAGNPINIGTGNKFEQVTDYATAGQNPLAFRRYYNSNADSASVATGLGRNWRSNFDRYLRLSSTSVVAERADGQEITFSLHNGVWTGDSDIDITLVTSGSTWMLTDNQDTVETYTADASGHALLSSIQARNGYLQTLSYSAGQLASVNDTYGRSLGFTYQNGLLQTVATPDNLTLAYGFNSSGATQGVLDRLISVTYSTTPQTNQTYLYENSALPFALTGITDEDGNRYATWTYDSSGRALSSQHAGGADLTSVAYNDTDESRTVTDPLGQQSVYKFTILQTVPKITEIDRLATSTTAAATRTFTYDSNGYLAIVTDWNGNQTTFTNDVHGQPTSITEAAGTPQARTTAITYHTTFHLPVQIVQPGLTTALTYDSSGELLTKTQTDTTTSTVPYSTAGQSRTWTYTWFNALLASAKGPRSDVSELTKFGYDSAGALTSTTNALGQVARITQHTPGGLPLTLIDANGAATNLTYDARLRLLTRTLTASAGPLTAQYAYDAVGNLLSVTLPDGSSLNNTYDAAHRLTATADLFQNTITYTLDAVGDRTNTVVSDPSGTLMRQHSATFDSLGRLLSDTGGAGQTTAFAYDANGNALTITDPLQRVTQQVFDPLNRVATATDPAQGNTAFAYDAHDRPLTVTDAIANTTTFTYDGFGDVIQEVSPARGTTVYRYDAAGNLIQKTDARGAVANYAYDALDRMVSESYPANPAENIAYTYDQASAGFGIGRLTSITDAVGGLARTYDERGNVLTESRTRGSGATALTLQTKYSYDAASRIASITYPTGTAVTYTRDSMGRVTAVGAQTRGAAAVSVLSKISYLPFGAASALTYGNGITETRTYDLDYRLTSLKGSGKSVVQGLTYAYNSANDVLSIQDGVTSANSQTFGYDALDRLTSAAGVYGNLTYTYDANGNRLVENPAAPITMDGLGTVSALTYNQSGRLATVGGGSQQLTQYTYDAFGQRLTKLGSSTALTYFQYDTGGRLLDEMDNQGSAKAEYIYLEGRPVAEYNGGKLYFLHDDWLGTPQVATDSNQALQWAANYMPFGALAPSSQTALLGLDLRLPGQEYDSETGLYHNGFRDYVSGVGRYGQSDPSSLRGSMNQYVYAAGNPLAWTDRQGLQVNQLYIPLSWGNQGLYAYGMEYNNPNVYSIEGHGTPTQFLGDGTQEISAEELAKKIFNDSNYRPGMTIMLISCNTGVGQGSYAQFLANAIGDLTIASGRPATGSSIVYAPNAFVVPGFSYSLYGAFGLFSNGPSLVKNDGSQGKYIPFRYLPQEQRQSYPMSTINGRPF